MSDIVLCSGNVPLTFSFPGETPSPERYSSTASTAVCYEQVFTETPDPKPKTEDWFNFITGFDAGNYSAFGMSAYVTSVMAINLYPESALPSTMQFRTVISTADGSGSGDSAYIPVDGIAGTIEWTVYSYDSATVAPGLLEVAHFEFSSSGDMSGFQRVYSSYDRWVTSNPVDGWVYLSGVPGPASASAMYKSKTTRTSTAELMTAFNHYLNDAQRATVTESGFWVDYPYVSESGISAKTSASGTASSNALNWTKEYFAFWGSGSGYTYSGYTGTATIAVPTIDGGAAYAYSLLTNDGRNLLNTSWVETEDLPTRTVLASASATGMLSSICGDYTGHVSASVGGYNDTYLMNPSGIVPGWDPKPTTGEDGYYWRMRSAWSAGLLTSTPYGCGLSGILELYPKGDTGSTHPILSSATGG